MIPFIGLLMFLRLLWPVSLMIWFLWDKLATRPSYITVIGSYIIPKLCPTLKSCNYTWRKGEGIHTQTMLAANESSTKVSLFKYPTHTDECLHCRSIVFHSWEKLNWGVQHRGKESFSMGMTPQVDRGLEIHSFSFFEIATCRGSENEEIAHFLCARTPVKCRLRARVLRDRIPSLLECKTPFSLGSPPPPHASGSEPGGGMHTHKRTGLRRARTVIFHSAPSLFPLEGFFSQ